MERQALIQQVVEKEWQQFTNVHNEGGRAFCQDDRKTFDIMRKSQFMVWPQPLLESYLADLDAAEAIGWSLLAEKYARMMQSTAPEEYRIISPQLPARSAQRLQRQERIIAREVQWLEEVYGNYPKLGQTGRPVRTVNDTPCTTSFETYQRGELGTYSNATFELYEVFIGEMEARNENLAKQILTNTAQLYGYSGLEAV